MRMKELKLQSKALNYSIEEMRCRDRQIKKWIANDKEDLTDKSRSKQAITKERYRNEWRHFI